MEKNKILIFLILLLILIIVFIILKLKNNKEHFNNDDYDVSKEEITEKLNEIQKLVEQHNQLEKKIEKVDGEYENEEDNKLLEEEKEKLNKLKEEIVEKSKVFDERYSLYEANKLTKDYEVQVSQIDRNLTDNIIRSKMNENNLIKKNQKITYPKRYLKHIKCYPRQTTFDEQYLESLNHSINRFLDIKEKCKK